MTVAVLMVLVGALLAGVNWYLKPEAFLAWAAALAVLAAMAMALRIAGRRSRDSVTLAGTIIAISLTAPLAAMLGVDGEFLERATMVITGAFFTVTGNSLPKMLTPLSALQCDSARVQACRRITGWIWVLTGLAMTGVALVLPMDLATRASLALMACGVFGTLLQIARVRRLRRQGA